MIWWNLKNSPQRVLTIYIFSLAGIKADLQLQQSGAIRRVLLSDWFKYCSICSEQWKNQLILLIIIYGKQQKVWKLSTSLAVAVNEKKFSVEKNRNIQCKPAIIYINLCWIQFWNVMNSNKWQICHSTSFLNLHVSHIWYIDAHCSKYATI